MSSTERLHVPRPETRGDAPPAVVMGDLTLVRALGLAKIPSVVVTTDPRDITLRSRHAIGRCVVPGFDAASAPRTVDALVELARRLRALYRARPPLYFGTDAQLAFVHQNRAALADAFLLLLNEDDVARALWDKELFDARARAVGVPVPPTARADDDGAVRRLRAPLLVKPRAKVAWRPLQDALFDGRAKARLFADHAELYACAAFGAFKHALLVQSHVPAATSDLPSFHALADETSRVLASFCGRKIRTYPAESGESSFIELTRERDVERLGRDVVRRLGARGALKIDMIRDPRDGALYVLEVNARYSLWSYLGAAHGVNLPAVAYDVLVRGKEPGAVDYAPRYRWLNLYRDLRACRDAKAEGTLRYVKWLGSLAARPKVYEAFAWSDPQPFAWWLADYVKKKVS